MVAINSRVPAQVLAISLTEIYSQRETALSPPSAPLIILLLPFYDVYHLIFQITDIDYTSILGSVMLNSEGRLLLRKELLQVGMRSGEEDSQKKTVTPSSYFPHAVNTSTCTLQIPSMPLQLFTVRWFFPAFSAKAHGIWILIPDQGDPTQRSLP